MNEGAFEEMRSKELSFAFGQNQKPFIDRVKNDNKRPLLKVKDPILQIKNIIE